MQCAAVTTQRASINEPPQKWPSGSGRSAIETETCNGPGAYKGLVDDNELCAGTDGADSCQGDSGGPLVAWDDKAGFLLMGLVSWGQGCGAKEKPGVYVRLSSHRPWIESKLAAK